MKRAFRLAFALTVTACGAATPTRAGGGIGPLSAHDVDWNPSHAVFGHVRAVADAGDVTAVFSDSGATVLSSGAVVAIDPTVTDWVGAGSMPSAEGVGTWLFGLSRSGHIYRLKDRSVFEDVSSRYGLDGIPIRTAASLGNGSIGFGLANGLAVADGHQVAILGAPPFERLVGGGGFGAGLESEGLFVFGAANRDSQRYPLPGLQIAALDSFGRVYASTARALYAAAPSGELTLRYESQSSALHGLVAAGNTVWFADGDELGQLTQSGVVETAGLHLSERAQLSPSSTGDVWALTDGSLRRLTGDRAMPAAALWSNTIAPIFARVCASCHQAGGVSGVDLSTAAAWESERAAIRNRVVETGTMPPEGHALPEADRAIIASWLRH